MAEKDQTGQSLQHYSLQDYSDQNNPGAFILAPFIGPASFYRQWR